MDPIQGVEFIQGDFTEQEALEGILASMGGKQADLVISDMAPNLSGMKEIDQPRGLYLAELAMDLAVNVLKPNGALLIKVFQGAGLDQFTQDLRGAFKSVKTRKPQASRARSAEMYLLAEEFMAAR